MVILDSNDYNSKVRKILEDATYKKDRKNLVNQVGHQFGYVALIDTSGILSHLDQGQHKDTSALLPAEDP